MTDALRAAAEQALASWDDPMHTPGHHEAMKALRVALAAPAQAEPSGEEEFNAEIRAFAAGNPEAEAFAERLIAAAPPAPQPKQPRPGPGASEVEVLKWEKSDAIRLMWDAIDRHGKLLDSQPTESAEPVAWRYSVQPYVLGQLPPQPPGDDEPTR